ncbi:putative reverse transcriptase domain-containing protein [Tanacetum coccineum]
MHVILFDTIRTTIPDTTLSVIPPFTHIDTALTPISPDYTPASPDYSLTSDKEFDQSEDPSSDHIPPLLSISPFVSSTDDSSDSDTPDTPPSPNHGIPFTEMTFSTQSTLVASGALRRRVMILAPGQPIPHGRLYRYHLNGSVHMMTARNMVGPLPTHRLAVRHSFDYSSSDHFSSDDSSRDSSSSLSLSSSSETSSDSSADALSNLASSRSSSDHSLPAPSSGIGPSHHLCSLVPSIPRSSATISDRPSHDSSSASPSLKRSRSPAAYVPLSSPISGALSYARADLLPSPKRIRSPESATDLEVSLAEGSEPSRYRGTELEMDDDVVRSDRIDIDPEIQADIDECIAYADALIDRGIDARVIVKAVDGEEIKMGARGPVEVSVDSVTHPMIANDIPELAQEERAVEVTYETMGDLGHKIIAIGQQSVDMLERIRELERDNKRLKDMIDVMSQRVTQSQCRELRVQREMRQIWHFRFYDRMRIARLEACARRHLGYRALGARDAAKNLEPLIGGGGEQEEISGNGGNGNRGNGNGGANGNGNGNGGGNGYNPGGFVHVARECTYQDFLKCQPLSFNGTEGVVSALTWWNSYKRTIRIEAAYAMSWTKLTKLMTEVYCPRNEIQKMETELWNLAVKGNDITAYTRRFQELVPLCTRMVPNEEYKVERFIGGLPDNIQGNVIAAEPTKLQDAIRIANNLMDQKLKGYARKARMWQDLTWLGIMRKKGYVASLPYSNKCKLHHVGSCTMRYGNCKRVGHMTRDYKVIVTPNTQRAPVGNQPVNVCYECGRPGHFSKDYPMLRNQNCRKKIGNKNGNKTENQTGCNEAIARAYVIGGGGANPNSNIVTGTFLLNNCYASMLFDSGADKSFVSSTFSAFLDVALSTLDTSYAIELADGRIS